MKKFAVSVIVALLMSAGLVAASSTTATAAYPDSVDTITSASNFGAVNKNQRVRLRVNVDAVDSNRQPRGTIRVVFIPRNGGARPSYERAYNAPITYDFPALRRPGQYSVTVKYTAPNDRSVFKNSSTSTGQFVRNRPR